MTREEALNKTIGVLTYHQVNFCKSKEAVANMNEIIEALEKIDQEPCGDYISRDAVMHILDEVGGDFDSPREAVVPIDYIADMVSELPSATPQPCEDCISRQQAIDKMQELEEEDIEAYGCSIPEGFDGKRAIEAIKALSSVHPKPKVGRWIMSDDGLYRPICNNCGAHPWKGYIPTVEEATEAFKYCPTCGAKMQEVENETNN